MTLQSYVLLDASQSINADGAVFEAAANGSNATHWKVRMRTCRGGRSEGVQIVEIENGRIGIDVLPTRGMGIWRVRRGDHVLGWRAPAQQPVHPSLVPLMEPAGLGWLDGFNELLCRCGLESNGPPEFDDSGRLLRPLHGRIANTPAHHVVLEIDESAGLITLRGIADECRFHFQSLRLTSTLTTSFDADHFTWSDEVENTGGREASLQMLYHFNVGQPLLQPGARVVAPIATVAPLSQVAADAGIDSWNVMPPSRPGSAEQVYVAELLADQDGKSRLLLSGLANDNAVGLTLDKQTLPCFTLWRNTPAESDGYVVGLEPGTNFPNPRSFEQANGRVLSLTPGQKWSTSVTATWHTNRQSIAREEAAIRAIQDTQQPELLPQRRAGWSMGV